MPQIFDNIEKHLLPALTEAMGLSERADFCVGYFNLRGWKQVSSLIDKWTGGQGHCCRLLVGMQQMPYDQLRMALNPLKGEQEVDQATAIASKRKLAQEFRDQLTMGIPTNEDEAGGLYWKVFTDFAPEFRCNGKRSHSSRETTMNIAQYKHVKSCVAILSSDLFWWWYTITSNLRDLNPSDIQGFPIPESTLNDKQVGILGAKYLEDLLRNSTMLVRHQKQTGKTETQCFKIQKSKPIIDEIDRVLAKHYGFTDEELDFIINYDIKYRMGGDLPAEAESAQASAAEDEE